METLTVFQSLANPLLLLDSSSSFSSHFHAKQVDRKRPILGHRRHNINKNKNNAKNDNKNINKNNDTKNARTTTRSNTIMIKTTALLSPPSSSTTTTNPKSKLAVSPSQKDNKSLSISLDYASSSSSSSLTKTIKTRNPGKQKNGGNNMNMMHDDDDDDDDENQPSSSLPSLYPLWHYKKTKVSKILARPSSTPPVVHVAADSCLKSSSSTTSHPIRSCGETDEDDISDILRLIFSTEQYDNGAEEEEEEDVVIDMPPVEGAATAVAVGAIRHKMMMNANDLRDYGDWLVLYCESEGPSGKTWAIVGNTIMCLHKPRPRARGNSYPILDA